ncbi:hypothetical protein KVR01_010490 [Diaporthe batatas]|uniref:uncharacterized protein n=1 Tax=Diaporthe batatas TaxID=748121 RepID=UPI001D04A6A0|nr:uncharacterized protein KVR01_010490 [Diaporthe batatas]KAG8159853.1 hypothetical protein KVR01_010490 [Diaporthe batatas]
MVKPGTALKSHNKHMFKMLPKNGMHYSFWKPSEDEDDKSDGKTNNELRILPPMMSTKIMIKFDRKHKKEGTNATRAAFDLGIAQLFSNAANIVRSAGYHGQDLAAFWRLPKMGTFLETASDNTVSRFAAKMLQARENCLEKQDEILQARANDLNKQGKKLQDIDDDLENQRKMFHARDCEAAKAIDGFNRVIEVASMMSGGASALKEDQYSDEATLLMASYTGMTECFNDSDDTDASEAGYEPTDNDYEATDNEAHRAKRVKVEKPFATDGDVCPSFAEDFGNTPLTIRPRAPDILDGANKTNAKEAVMAPTNTGDAAHDVAPTMGTKWSDDMDRDTHVKWYWENKQSKPASYYDEILARSAKDSEMDYDLDDEEMDYDSDDEEMDLDM